MGTWPVLGLHFVSSAIMFSGQDGGVGGTKESRGSSRGKSAMRRNAAVDKCWTLPRCYPAACVSQGLSRFFPAPGHLASLSLVSGAGSTLEGILRLEHAIPVTTMMIVLQ